MAGKIFSVPGAVGTKLLSQKHQETCQFIVVPGNGQALLGLMDTDVLKLININIDSIDYEVAKNKECHTNMKAVWGFDTEQEKDGS